MSKPSFSLLFCLSLHAITVQAAHATDPAIVIPPGTVACNTEGWATDRDPKGLNVHAFPNLKAAPVATFKIRTDAANASNVQFQIKGFKDGWLLIEGGTHGDYGDPEPKEPVYAGKGWVSASMVAGQLLGGTKGLSAAPSKTAPVKTFGKDPDAVTVTKVLECKPDWIKVETSAGTGWVGGLCNNQVTTCP